MRYNPEKTNDFQGQCPNLKKGWGLMLGYGAFTSKKRCLKKKSKKNF